MGKTLPHRPWAAKRPISPDVAVEAFGHVAEILLAGRLKLKPAFIYMLHSWATPQEREDPFSRQWKVVVWVRVVWADKSETLGFVDRTDADLIWAAFPRRTQRITRVVKFPS